MEKQEIAGIRHFLGKTQNQMAQLLGTSVKAVQSFEQGWRNIPVHVERMAFFYLFLKNGRGENGPCWELRDCPEEIKKNCPAWEFEGGDLCWFICGTICHGKKQESWRKKMEMCRKCMVFRGMLPKTFTFPPRSAKGKR